MKDCIHYKTCNGSGFCSKGLINTPCGVGCELYVKNIDEAIKESWNKNAGESVAIDGRTWHIHEQAFMDGMR